MTERIIDTKFGKVMAGIAAIASAAYVTLFALEVAGRPVFEKPPSVSGVVVSERYGRRGHYLLRLNTGGPYYNGYEFAISAEGADADAAARLDELVSAGSRVTIYGLPTGNLTNPTPFLGPLSPSQVKVEE